MRRMTFNAAELDKFIILSGDFNFETEVLEEASKHEPWSKIVNVFKSDKTEAPILVYDIGSNTLYIGYKDSDTIFVNSLDTNINKTVELIYSHDEDQLTINVAEESFISEDNVKTLFGNQSIIGSGNIDLYRHQMTLTNTSGVAVDYVVYSSNNLKCDSPQDFVTVTKCDTGEYVGFGLYLASGKVEPAYIRYSAGNIIIQVQGGGLAPVKSVTDIVTTI